MPLLKGGMFPLSVVLLSSSPTPCWLFVPEEAVCCHPAVPQGSYFSTCLSALSVLLIVVIPMGVKWYHSVVLFSISLMTKEHLLVVY